MNKFLKFCFSLTLILSAGFITSCGEDDPAPYGDRDAVSITKKNPTALLLCSFGSTYEQPQATYDYQDAYPNTDIYMSFTSRAIQ